MLRRGDRGESVYELQEQLALAAILTVKLTAFSAIKLMLQLFGSKRMPGYQWMALLAQKHGALLLRRFSPNHTVRMW